MEGGATNQGMQDVQLELLKKGRAITAPLQSPVSGGSAALLTPWFGPLKTHFGDFPGSPVVKTSPSSVEGAGSLPGEGATILHSTCLMAKNPKHKTEAIV